MGLRGAPAGDLYIFVNVKNHPIFEREGSHLFVRVPVPMATAALGGTIDVPTLAGRMVRLQIEKGTQTGRKFRMRGKVCRHCAEQAKATRLLKPCRNPDQSDKKTGRAFIRI